MSEPPPPRYANVRDSVTAMREFIIVVAMLSILFAPNRVKGILEDAGIRSLAGVEFDATNLAESQASVKEAHSNIRELKQQLALAQRELSKVAKDGGSFANPGLGAISDLLASAQRATIETETNLDRSQQKTRNFLQRHGHPHDLSSSGSSPEQPMPQLQRAATGQLQRDGLFQR